MVGAACMAGEDYPVNTTDNPPYLSSCNFLSFHLGYTFKMDFEIFQSKQNYIPCMLKIISYCIKKQMNKEEKKC